LIEKYSPLTRCLSHNSAVVMVCCILLIS
jgi:hypothetical protein